MTLEDYQASLPPGLTVPEAHADLLAHAAAHGGQVVSGLELGRHDPDGLVAWFADLADPAEQLVVLGSSPDGGFYAYWRYDGRDLATAPIVYLDSEGGKTMLAATFDDFLALLALGVDEVGHAAMRGERLVWQEADGQAGEELAAYRAWFAARGGAPATIDGNAIVTAARAGHPDFAAWVRAALASV